MLHGLTLVAKVVVDSRKKKLVVGLNVLAYDLKMMILQAYLYRWKMIQVVVVASEYAALDPNQSQLMMLLTSSK